MRLLTIFILNLALLSAIILSPAHATETPIAEIFDIDGNNEAKPLSDGLLLLRYLFDFRGDALINQAIGHGATRATASQIETYIDDHLIELDIDGNGQTKPLSDGLLLLRYLFDFRGDALIDRAISANATRIRAVDIGSYIQNLVETTVVFMGVQWAEKVCASWNEEPLLTDWLVELPSDDFGEGYKWIENDVGRGFKLIQMYRDTNGCGSEKSIQFNIAKQNGRAMCIYGGIPDGKEMNPEVDYIMHATDENWTCMGEGLCDFMGVLMTGKLKFQGPKIEIFKIESSFSALLKLTGSIPSVKSGCH